MKINYDKIRREQVINALGKRCQCTGCPAHLTQYCYEYDVEIDHINPMFISSHPNKSRLRKNTYTLSNIHNLRLLCRPCHQYRHGKKVKM